ncbi:MAG: ArsA family ATPase, partial [Pseudomonadota bacterium]
MSSRLAEQAVDAADGRFGLHELLQRRLLFVTGKGGTGKTSLCAALALVAARAKKTVCLAETDPRSVFADVFGQPVEFKPREVAPGISATNIDFLRALANYLGESVSAERVISALLRNRLVRLFLDATPAAREMVVLHRIFQLTTRFDLVLVDLPASGHSTTMLGTPQTALRIFRVGPVRRRALEMQELLADPRRCELLLVSLPEEMSVNETLETYHRARHDLQINCAHVLINGLWQAVVPD